MNPSVPPVRCRWPVGITVVLIALLATGAVLWHRATFGQPSDAWNLGNNLTLSLVCRPILGISPFLALLALFLALRFARRGRRVAGIALITINSLVLLITSSVSAWDWKSRQLLASPQPLTPTQAKWFTPWGWTQESRLHHAILSQQEDLARKCIAAGAGINNPAPQPQWRPSKGPTPLETALQTGNHSMVRLLISLGADAHQGDHRSPIWTVLETGDWDMLEVMHGAGAQVPGNAMAFACRMGRTDLLAWLIRHGWDIHAAAGAAGATELERCGHPLHVAAACGQIEIANMLLEHGADINARDSEGHHTPLNHAAQREDTEMLSFLLAHGANPSITTRHGWNAMHIAAFSGSPEAIKVLHAHNPTLIHSLTYDGTSPLWFACLAYRKPTCLSTVRMLIAMGANIHITDAKDRSLVDMLRQDQEIMRARGDTESVQKIESVILLLQSSP